MKVRTAFVTVIVLAGCGGSVVVPSQTSGSSGGTGGTTSSSASTTASSSSSTGVGGDPNLCGGLKGWTCGPDEWCQYSNQDCGGNDDTGLCETRPADCTGVPSKPVCGCDGKTYANACLAQQAGTDTKGTGSCATPGVFACGPSLFCQTGQEYCDDANGIVAEWNCRPLPASCLPPNIADCNCMPIPPDCGSCSSTNGQITESHGCG